MRSQYPVRPIVTARLPFHRHLGSGHDTEGANVTDQPDVANGKDPVARPAIDAASLLSDGRDILADVVALRRKIHAEPELGLELPQTQAHILDTLADLDLDITTGTSLSSVVATMTGDADGPTLLLRADMDALPMSEDTGLDFASTDPGAMHACGHDAHVAMLYGAVRLLHQRRSDLRGTVKFLFQPGEEGFHGAEHCIEEGVLTGPVVDTAFALHISPNIPSGSFATRPGPFMASADEFTMTITGKGGHASSPHMAVDPIPVAAELVLALQAMITRSIDAFNPAVLTVAQIVAGTTSNVIPETAMLKATLRTVSEGTRSQVHDSLHRVAHHVAAAHGCEADVDIRIGYPVTVNDPGVVDLARDVLIDLVGDDQVIDMPAPIMGAEDWSYVLQEVPGCLVFLGVCPPAVAPANAAACHSNRMIIDEDAMAIGAAAHAAMALSYLS
ncbi:MAG: amidohydrolase [Actinomycetia bacterium]|nr:amidohydrolase [Actinomycetes bacterium]MCP4222859.1 amidohydrolase [Actinomycetes bacterium]MCP5033567.1 amidohydrolase [Actinomycetes bacterium]